MNLFVFISQPQKPSAHAQACPIRVHIYFSPVPIILKKI